MTTIQFTRTRRTPVTLSVPAFLRDASHTLGRFGGRVVSAYSERLNLMQIESLPDDLRKDIGWPGGPSGR